MHDTHHKRLLFDNLELINKVKLAEKTQLSVSYINKLMKEEGLPYYKIGRSVRFDPVEVMAWLKERNVP